ncbi:MAG: hypothetical protein ABI867_32480 [Kofleriaceae bacterium]
MAKNLDLAIVVMEGGERAASVCCTAARWSLIVLTMSFESMWSFMRQPRNARAAQSNSVVDRARATIAVPSKSISTSASGRNSFACFVVTPSTHVSAFGVLLAFDPTTPEEATCQQ